MVEIDFLFCVELFGDFVGDLVVVGWGFVLRVNLENSLVLVLVVYVVFVFFCCLFLICVVINLSFLVCCFC